MSKLTKMIFFLLLCPLAIKSQKFPPNFKFGVSTSAYQIEGGWNMGGKGENIWDIFSHTNPQLITDQSNGDVACDSYHLWREDVAILKDLGVDHYRFSISWVRILPGGFANNISADGVAYYNNLINALIDKGIEPMVTLYHYDLPQTLQILGGWPNPLIAGYFEDYANVVFNLFGDRVKTWITINEPRSVCIESYEYDEKAPAFIKLPGIALYLCGKTLLLAHARAYRLYETKYKKDQKGKVGISLGSNWAEPKTNKSEDVEAAERYMQMWLGWWAHPIFSKKGDYPAIMKQRIAASSKAENFGEFRLPALTPQEIKYIQGTADFFGLNHYKSVFVENYSPALNSNQSFEKDMGALCPNDPMYVSWGFAKLLNWVAKEYANPEVVISENGFGDAGGLDDKERVLYLQSFLQVLLDAIQERHCNVTGYTVWSLMDNMEWRKGYTAKFGLYQVDFTDPLRTRTSKKSAIFYKNVIQTRVLNLTQEMISSVNLTDNHKIPSLSASLRTPALYEIIIITICLFIFY